MTEKEATIFIIDVGQSMGRKNQGRLESDLDWAMRYVWDKITTAVSLTALLIKCPCINKS